jgi:signal transduction histidine kinase
MKSSIRQKLLAYMSGIVAFVVIFAWLFNSLFLERFYIYYKSGALLRFMHTINQMYNTGAKEDFDLELLRLQMEQGIQAVIFGSNLDIRWMTFQTPGNIMFNHWGPFGGPDLIGFIQRNKSAAAASYEISRNYDDRLRMENLDLVGALDNGNYVLLRMPVQTITDSVVVANRFLLLTGVMSLLVAVFISARMSGEIAKPIRAVEDIAKSMSNLDFSRRIAVKSRDEIGSLASSINSLSDRLQGTIQELQGKNRQLEDDILYISKLDERRKEFLSSVSHELKTPIALIRGYAEALEERVVTSDESRDFYYHVLSDEADKMNALVKKLMNLNNLEAGQEELYLEDFDIVAMIQSVMQRGKSLPGAEELGFQYAGPDAAWVHADDFLIEEVIFNYVTNAIHYASGRNLIRVNVRELRDGPGGQAAMAAAAAADGRQDSAPQSAGGGAAAQAAGDPKSLAPPDGAGSLGNRRIRVDVFNSGSSLSDEERELVWDSFYKADKSRSREYGGSGLGLTVVRAVMERHQCAFGVENIDDGVSFWFELPAAQDDSPMK